MRDATHAVERVHHILWQATCTYAVEGDIRAFFDSVPHELVLLAVRRHTDEKWILLYVERWLKAPLQQEDGTLVQRDRGTPQGSSIYLHDFDEYIAQQWEKHPKQANYAQKLSAYTSMAKQGYPR